LAQAGKGNRQLREGGGTNRGGDEPDRAFDGGHVRSVRDYQVRSFEVLLAQVRNDDGKQIVFSSVPAEAISQQGQLRGVLHRLGATAVTLVTVLSDGAEGPRALGEAASPGPTHHVLDWFHLSMRIQHVDQVAKSWPDVSADDRQTGANLVEIIDRIRWRLWHGQVARGLDLTGETLATLDGVANSKESAAARKVARLLGDLETYICGESSITPQHQDERFHGGHGKYRAMASSLLRLQAVATALLPAPHAMPAEAVHVRLPASRRLAASVRQVFARAGPSPSTGPPRCPVLPILPCLMHGDPAWPAPPH
jgi:hypothetical protein